MSTVCLDMSVVSKDLVKSTQIKSVTAVSVQISAGGAVQRLDEARHNFVHDRAC